MKKLLIILIFIVGCGSEAAPKTSLTTVKTGAMMWYEAKEWEIVDVREPMTPEEVKRCQAWNYTYKIATIRNGDNVKEIIVRR